MHTPSPPKARLAERTPMQAYPHHYDVHGAADVEGSVLIRAEGLPTLTTAPPQQYGGPGDQWSPETLLVAAVAEAALAAPRNGIVEIAGPERAPFNEIVARYLKAVGDPREVVRDPEARYWGGRVEERSLVPLGDARLGRIRLDEWLRRKQARA
jgi:hypothetical protein